MLTNPDLLSGYQQGESALQANAATNRRGLMKFLGQGGLDPSAWMASPGNTDARSTMAAMREMQGRFAEQQLRADLWARRLALMEKALKQQKRSDRWGFWGSLAGVGAPLAGSAMDVASQGGAGSERHPGWGGMYTP